MRGIRGRLTYANVMATLAFVIAVAGGTAYAANTVFSTDIVNGEVNAADIATGAVNAASSPPTRPTREGREREPHRRGHQRGDPAGARPRIGICKGAREGASAE